MGVDNGHTAVGADQLRILVREVLAEVIGTHGPPQQVRQPPPRPVDARPLAGNELGPWTVRIETDDDLNAFARQVLRLADNPKLRRDLIAGRIRFAVAGPPAAASSAVHRVEKGAVSERTVAAAAKAGAKLVLGTRAVLTPLAKDKARALGVPIERER